MAKWIPCGAEFAHGDIIRWIEPYWKPRESPKTKGEIIGYRLVEAQVMRCDRERATLEIRPDGCKVHMLEGWKAEPLESVIRRSRDPIGRGNAQRLLVGDESGRAIVASRYLNEEERLVEAAPKYAAPHPDAWPPPLPRGQTGGASHRKSGRGRKGPQQRPKR
jgi:hypothetical protein